MSALVDELEQLFVFAVEHGNTLRAHKAFGEMYRDLRGKVADLEAAARWIPLEERLPDDDIEVLVGRADCGDVLEAFREDGRWFDPGSDAQVHAVTHWMDLPAAPTLAGKGVA